MHTFYVILGVTAAVVFVLGWCAIWHAGSISQEEPREENWWDL
jgi:hypothetical protein